MAFDKRIKELLDEMTPIEYDETTTVYYKNGFVKGYESGVNAPIKKLQCGKDDGIMFAQKLREKAGKEFYYEGATKTTIDNAAKNFLNDAENIPQEFRKTLYNRWYKESFLNAVRNALKRPVSVDDVKTVENANNVIQHLISRLFQFLYI